MDAASFGLPADREAIMLFASIPSPEVVMSTLPNYLAPFHRTRHGRDMRALRASTMTSWVDGKGARCVTTSRMGITFPF